MKTLPLQMEQYCAVLASMMIVCHTMYEVLSMHRHEEASMALACLSYEWSLAEEEGVKRAWTVS